MAATTAEASLLELQALDPSEIAAMPWEPVRGLDGVDQKVLWRFGDYTEVLVRYRPGATTAGGPHLAAHHHIWVVSGVATIAGRRMPAGSYLHVPPGVRHRVEDVGPDGCTVLQMHRPHAPVEADAIARPR